ncbi:MAG: ABC transporter ATP-binding protein [Syntrophorhabdales bacterium]|jgi:branched-chain amino acid transport system ATP-binding protein
MALLEIEHVTQYFGGLQALADFNLSLEARDLVAVIGPNGAGKTTVFNVVTGVYRPKEGSIAIDGRHVVGLAPNRITSLGIARTFQNVRLFKDLSVLDNVRIASYGQVGYGPIAALFQAGRCKQEENTIVEKSMELLSLFHLDACADERARNLPYGLQRRLEIARALATRPRILLLDEPAAGMNPGEVGQLVDLIGWVQKAFGVAILLIEHQMQLVMNLCQRIIVLDFGKTIAEGRPDEIRSNKRVLEAYLGEDQVT